MRREETMGMKVWVIMGKTGRLWAGAKEAIICKTEEWAEKLLYEGEKIAEAELIFKKKYPSSEGIKAGARLYPAPKGR